MTEREMDDERLAALLDGRVQGAERDALLERLAASGDDFRDFAEAAAVLREAEADEPAPGARPPVHAAPPSTRGSRGWRRPTRWVALAAVVLLAASVALLGRMRGADPREPGQVAALLSAPAAPLPADWVDRRPWSGTLGAESPLSRPERAARAGALHVDLVVAATARDTAATARLAAELASLVGDVPGSNSVVEAYRGVGRLAGGAPAPLAAALEPAGRGAAALLGPGAVELGAWTEAARLAAGRRDAAFFEARASQAALRRASALPSPAGPRAERVRAALTGPDWGALAPALDELLRALAG